MMPKSIVFILAFSITTQFIQAENSLQTWTPEIGAPTPPEYTLPGGDISAMDGEQLATLMMAQYVINWDIYEQQLKMYNEWLTQKKDGSKNHAE